MANFQNRTRVVYVRVSEDEFLHFRELRQQHGAKNMSELVRSAMRAMACQQASGFEREVTLRLQQLEASLDRLNLAVEQIMEGKPA
jgi:predicted secreted protein